MGDLVRSFGAYVEKQMGQHPVYARRLLLAAYRAYGLKLRLLPSRELPLSKRYLARVSMACMVRPLSHPSRQILTSVFTPCEVFHAMGLYPMCAEQFATYANGAGAEHGLIEAAERAGISETFCSYHKAVTGAAVSGVLPKPLAVVNTSLACDANNLTFRKAAELLGAPQYYIDVPWQTDGAAVEYVAEQLREMAAWLCDLAGRKLSQERLKESVERSRQTIRTLCRVIPLRKERYVPADLTSEMYEVLMVHNALGMPETLRYAEMLLRDYEQAGEWPGKKILWLHSNPFYQKAVQSFFNYSSDPFLALTEMCYDPLLLSEETDPWRAMAERLVMNSFNGPVERRIGKAVQMARQIGADGAVLFCHWGCKQTCGAAATIRSALEEEGIPTLILNGDGVDRRNAPDGQTSTRIGAFLEMLEGMP